MNLAQEYVNYGKAVYQAPDKEAIQISLPHILRVNISAPFGSFTVKLFGANSNYQAFNFGNRPQVSITYISGNPLVPFTYNDLLGSIFSSPMQIGITRVDAVTRTQAQRQLNVLYNPGVGKFDGEGLFPAVYPDQFVPTITYIEKVYMIDNNTLITYLQNGTTNPSIQLRFYQSASLSLDRPLSNTPVVVKYSQPPTGITQQVQIISPAKVFSTIRNFSL